MVTPCGLPESGPRTGRVRHQPATRAAHCPEIVPSMPRMGCETPDRERLVPEITVNSGVHRESSHSQA